MAIEKIGDNTWQDDETGHIYVGRVDQSLESVLDEVAAAGTGSSSYPVTSAAIDVERDRRIADGFTFNGLAYQLDDKSKTNVTAAGADARFAIAGGAQPGDLRWADPDNDFGWIASDNTVTSMDATTMVDFSTAAKFWVTKHIFAARALKDMEPIPADYEQDTYWP